MDDNQVEQAQAGSEIPRVQKEDIEVLFNTQEFEQHILGRPINPSMKEKA